MRYVRLILACLIALSVATLPAVAAAGAFAAVAKSAEPAVSSPMPDCCDHEMPPCDNHVTDMGLCGTMGCMAKCFSYVGAASPGVPLAPIEASVQPSWTADPVLLKIGSPPFRPPRV
jgi:hypothetical protein